MKIYFSNIYLFSLINSFIFCFSSYSFYFFNIKNYYQILPASLFFLFNLIFFVKFLFKNNIFLIFPWAIFFSSCFIFFGTIGSYLRYDFFHSSVILDVTISFANTFNGLSLTIISLICLFLVKNNKEKMSLTKIKFFFEKLFLYHDFLLLTLILLFIIKISFYFTSNPSNLSLSFLSKINILENGLYLFLFIFFFKLNPFKKTIFLLIFILNLIFNLSFLSKFLILKLLFLAFIGLLFFSKRKIRFCILASCIISISFFILTPFINLARIHDNKVQNKKSLISKFEILHDTSILMISKNFNKNVINNFNKNFIIFNLDYFKKEKQNEVKKLYEKILSKEENQIEMDEYFENLNKFKRNKKKQFNNNLENDINNFKKNELSYLHRLKMITYRLDVLSTQRFLIDKYLKNEKGDTLKNIIYIFVPRFVWKDKPIMTDNSVILHNLFYGNYNVKDGNYQLSGLAPSIHIEALWNFGILGFIFISIFFGIFLSFFSNILINSNSPIILFGYIMIFDPLFSVVLFYESWIISFLGQSIIFIVLFFLIVITLKMLSKLKIINL